MKLENTFKDWFSSLLGSVAMIYAGYGWHMEWITSKEAGIVAFIGFVLLFLRTRLTQVIGQGLEKVFDAVMKKIFGGGTPPTAIILLVCLAISSISFAQNKPINAWEVRLLDKTDSTLISGVGQVRWNSSTGRFRFGNGTSWSSMLDRIGTIDSQAKSVSGGVIADGSLIFQTADASFPGLVSTGTQTFVGAKTFNGVTTITNTTGQILIARSGTDPNYAELGVWAGATDQIKAQVSSYLTNGTIKIGARSNHPVLFTIADTEKMRLATDGKVGIGTSPSTGTLEIKNSGSYPLLFIGNALEASNKWAFKIRDIAEGDFGIYDVNAAVYRMYFNASGNVGIGTTTLSSTLEVQAAGASSRITTTGTGEVNHVLRRTGGTLAEWSTYIPSGSTDLRFWNGGDRFTFSDAGVGTAADWVATSDRRLKKNFKRVGSQLKNIEEISTLIFNYDRKDNGKNETGFIAQELLKVAPEYVNVPEDTASMMSVNYSKMVVPLYKAVAELTAEVEKLKAEIKRLKK